MHCPFCNHKDSRVLESRFTSEGQAVKRRRECESCQKRFTTYERIEVFQLLVVKRSGEREPFHRDKIHAGVARACYKTMVTANQVDELVDSLENELSSMGKREIPSATLGEMILVRLRQLNQVAYVRFASVYRQFRSVGDFIAELENLSTKEESKKGKSAFVSIS